MNCKLTIRRILFLEFWLRFDADRKENETTPRKYYTFDKAIWQTTKHMYIVQEQGEEEKKMRKKEIKSIGLWYAIYAHIEIDILTKRFCEWDEFIFSINFIWFLPDHFHSLLFTRFLYESVPNCSMMQTIYYGSINRTLIYYYSLTTSPAPPSKFVWKKVL